VRRGVKRPEREVERVVRAWVNSVRRGAFAGVVEKGGWALFQDWAKKLMGGVWIRMGEITTGSVLGGPYVARSWTVLCWQANESRSRARMYDVPGSLSIS
jgi:hypothetical protein